LLILLFVMPLWAGTEEGWSVSYFGFIRTALVSEPAFSGQTFSVFHARGGISGNVTRDLSYKLYMEFSNLGSLEEVYDITGNLVGVDVKMPLGLLDAFINWQITEHLALQAGQFKTPYSDSNLRNPAKMPFINRPVTRYAAPHIRDIGIKFIWKAAELPLTFETGLFNGSGMNAVDTDRSLNAAGRLAWAVSDLHRISGNLYMGRQNRTDLKMVDVGYEYKGTFLNVAAEYARRYDDDTASQAACFFMTKSLKTPWEKIYQMTPAFRLEWDDFRNNAVTLTGGLTGHLSGQEYTLLRVNTGWNPKSGDTFITLLLQIFW
jgi:hypothetical protein